MNPTLYDILWVAPEATPDEIKRAWRDAADRFDPSTGSSGQQFRLFNDAAAVLLDADRRRAYDAELAGAPAVEAGPSANTRTRDAPASGDGGGADSEHPLDRSSLAAKTRQALASPCRAPARALLVGLAVAAVVLIGAALAYGVPKAVFVHHEDQTAAARQAAVPAAERAADAVLAYDYTALDADEKAATGYLSPAYAKKYTATFDKLVKANATRLKAHVKAAVKGSAVIAADPGRVVVLLYVDQTTKSTANGGQAQLALNRVKMTMVELNGRWLVDDITSY